MSEGIGALEAIANTLTMISSKLTNIDEKLEAAGLESVGTTTKSKAGATPTDDTTTSTRGKKTASKKTASKKTASRKKSGDISDITTFKKMLFDAGDASGLPDVMPKVKAFIVAQGYKTSDKIAVEDREEFLTDLKDHLAELAEGEEEGEADDDIDL